MKNQLKTILLLGTLSALLLLVGGLVSPGMLWVMGFLVVAMNLGAYFFSDRLVLAMNRAHEVSPQEQPDLHRIVADLAESARIPKPRVYIVNDERPNAFATGRNPEHGVVAVTTGIMGLLDERELRGVLSHELSHIRNRDVLIASVAAMIAGVIAMIASIVKWGALFGFGGRDRDGGNIFAALALAIVAPIAATIIQLAISRSREYGADASGARISGDPEALASALSKLDRGNRRRLPFGRSHLADNPATASLYICSPLSGESISRWFSTHPPTAERIKRLHELAGAM